MIITLPEFKVIVFTICTTANFVTPEKNLLIPHPICAKKLNVENREGSRIVMSSVIPKAAQDCGNEHMPICQQSKRKT